MVSVRGIPWACFDTDSGKDRRIAAVSLVHAGLVNPTDVCAAFGISRATLYRDRGRVAAGGLSALVGAIPGPKGPTKATAGLKQRARALHSVGHSKRQIAVRLGVSDFTIRQLLKGTASASSEQHTLPVSTTPDRVEIVAESAEENEQFSRGEAGAEDVGVSDRSGFSPAREHPGTTSDTDVDRSLDRALARAGLLDEAEPRYVGGENLAAVGALLMIPALVGTGFFAGVEAVYGRLKAGFYGLRHTVLTLALMLALRLRRAEHLTGFDPESLGRLLGLDRAPEVKTFRRRLKEIVERGQAANLMQWFGSFLANEEGEALAFLMVDGHVRPYFGGRNVPKTYVTRLRLAMRATTDVWVNDANGSPVLVVTGEVTSSLTKAFLPLLAEVRKAVGPDARPTVVFDRGGWSPKLFRKVLKMGFDILTYRKEARREYPRSDFQAHTCDGNERKTILLRDGVVRLGRGLQLRCVARLDDDGRQVHVVTSNRTLAPTEVVRRIGDRWRQENFFKYGGVEFGLDALDTYSVEPDDPNRTIPNPERRALEVEIRNIEERIQSLEASLGRAVDANPETTRPSTRGFKIAHASLRQELATLRGEADLLRSRKYDLPKRVPVCELPEPSVKLAVEHKHFTNIVRMAVYRAETALLRQLQSHYRRADEDGRALLREAFRATGAIHHDGRILHVTLNPLSAPRRSRAIAALCDDLNRENVRMPGTSLRLHFAVREESVS